MKAALGRQLPRRQALDGLAVWRPLAVRVSVGMLSPGPVAALQGALGGSWPTTRCTMAASMARFRSIPVSMSLSHQQINQILGRDGAGRPHRRIREQAAAQPTHRRVESGDTELHGGVGTGEARPRVLWRNEDLAAGPS